MPQYVKDDDGRVHVIDIGSPGGEFTFCSRATDGDDSSHGENLEAFSGQWCRGPSTCRECKTALERVRDDIKNVRFFVS